MNKLVLMVSFAAMGAIQTLAWAQQPAAVSRSVLRPAEHVEYADFHAGRAGGYAGSHGGGGCGCATTVGCSTGIRYGYDSCCPRPHLLCAIKRVGRMLDCLLPCNKCCPGGSLFGGCRPHLFQRGHCGGGNMGCTTACNSCSTPMPYPQHLSDPLRNDPFRDDPVPPRPMPEPARDVRYRPSQQSPLAARANISAAAHSPSPYKVTTGRQQARQPTVEAATRRQAQPINPRDKTAYQSGIRVSPAQPAVLQQAAVEQEVAQPAELEVAPSAPALLPVTIQRTSAQVELVELEIPVNPLRR
ncbi:MAG: hypothetical protein WD872_11615 [Pirellulaceae bacterium]